MNTTTNLQKTEIPNELRITLRTSIPGFQKLEYKPTMTIPKIGKDDNIVNFNPLVKLNKSVIDQIPKDIRVKEFFNKGLFNSLINFHGSQPTKTLEQATKEGYVDNNIKVTIDTIFPAKSVIYISGQPYVIVDALWSKGDWQVNTKPIDINRLVQKQIVSSIVKEDEISREKLLETLPSTVLYGPNFTGVKTSEIPLPTALATPVSTPVATPIVTARVPETSGAIIPFNKPIKSTQSTALITQPTPTKISKIPTIEQEKPEEIKYVEDQPVLREPTLEISQKSTKFLRDYFSNLYFMVNTIYKNMNVNFQKEINKIYLNTTTINVKIGSNNISELAYKETVKGMKANLNTGEGDCYFIAVADAINYYNFTNQSNRITHNNYGNGVKWFTQKYLRYIVGQFIIQSPNLPTYKITAQERVTYLNSFFEKKLKESITEQDPSLTYTSLLDFVYKSGDNFLIQKPETIPTINDINYYKPFQLLQTNADIMTYIQSNNYWANVVAIDALCKVLNLNIITIEKIDGKLRIPFMNDCTEWNRYMFLYYNNNHYELITFNYLMKKIIKKPTPLVSKTKMTVSIFDKSDDKIMPPLYILFVIYATFYFNLDADSKASFSFLPTIFKAIEGSFYKIYEKKDKDKQDEKFITSFTSNFTTNDDTLKTQHDKYLQIGDQLQIEDQIQVGGDVPNRMNYNPYTIGQNPYTMGQNPYAVKNLNKLYDNSNTSYYITLDLELQIGDQITSQQMSDVKCVQRYNAIKKSYSEFTGTPYVIPPVYANLPGNKTTKNTITRNSRNTNTGNTNNQTRKNR